VLEDLQRLQPVERLVGGIEPAPGARVCLGGASAVDCTEARMCTSVKRIAPVVVAFGSDA